MEEAFDCPALNLTILPKKRGYSIHFSNILNYFDEKRAASVLKAIEGSYFYHFYSHVTDNITVTKDSTSAYVQVVKKACPKVFESSEEPF